MAIRSIKLPDRMTVPFLTDSKQSLAAVCAAYADPVMAETEAVVAGVRKKVAGYASQDKRQGRPHGNNATMTEVIEMLVASKMRCCYCRSGLVIDGGYRQWSLDRIDNDRPHTRDNCVVSCLLCNLERRRMDHDRFTRGKRLTVIRAGHSPLGLEP